jgi:hypothetical protein
MVLDVVKYPPVVGNRNLDVMRYLSAQRAMGPRTMAEKHNVC